MPIKKTQTITPTVLSTRNVGKAEEEAKDMAEKKTTITYKTTPKPAEGLAQVLAETERTIQELTRMFASFVPAPPYSTIQ